MHKHFLKGWGGEWWEKMVQAAWWGGHVFNGMGLGVDVGVEMKYLSSPCSTWHRFTLGVALVAQEH